MTDELSMLSRVYVMVTEFLVTYSFQLLGAVLILAAGTLVSRATGRAVLSQCTRKRGGDHGGGAPARVDHHEIIARPMHLHEAKAGRVAHLVHAPHIRSPSGFRQSSAHFTLDPTAACS